MNQASIWISQDNEDSSLRINEPGQVPRHTETTETKRATNLDTESSEHKTTIVDERSKVAIQLVKVKEYVGVIDTLVSVSMEAIAFSIILLVSSFWEEELVCKEGSACKFLHEKDTDVPRLPMRQSSRRHETAESD